MAKTTGEKVSILRARRIVADFNASPLSAEKYAKARGMNPGTLRWYVVRVKNHDAKKAANSTEMPNKKCVLNQSVAVSSSSPDSLSQAFVTLQPGTPTVETSQHTQDNLHSKASPPGLSLKFTNLKCTLRIDEGVNLRFLKSVVEALGSCSS